MNEFRKFSIEFIGQEVGDVSDADLTKWLTEAYGPSVIPPCRVCGKPLTMQACGGGKPTGWACSGQKEDGPGWEEGRSPADKHYRDSYHEDRRRGGDEYVMEALRRWELRRMGGE